jgi:Tat protein translocase TatB subunit
MFDLGIQELIVIFIVALIVFGPKRLPELGQTLGRGMLELKKALAEVKSQMDTEIHAESPPKHDPPTAAPPEPGTAPEPYAEQVDAALRAETSSPSEASNETPAAREEMAEPAAGRDPSTPPVAEESARKDPPHHV